MFFVSSRFVLVGQALPACSIELSQRPKILTRHKEQKDDPKAHSNGENNLKKDELVNLCAQAIACGI